MLTNSSGVGKNPYIFNFISFSGHGITINSDSIALIPSIRQKREDGKPVLDKNGEPSYEYYFYPLNLSYWARRFA
jgi:hypothetical protein